jgi:transposase InsO family protein
MESQEKAKKELALFKFSLIAPVVNGTYKEKSKIAYFRSVCEEPLLFPDGRVVRVAAGTVKHWYQKYTHGGLKALVTKPRTDLGKARAISEDAMKQVECYLEEFPYITGKKIYEKLIEGGYINKTDFSIDSLYRYLNNAGLSRRHMEPDECLSFEFAYANDCWQADSTAGPIIKKDGRNHQTYLIAIIDDKSRLIVHGELFFNDNAENVQLVLKKAIKKFGCPKKFFVDNGGPYRNLQLEWICASLGITKIHSKPYRPKGSGKIERSHRTTKDNWMNTVNWNDFSSLEELNLSYHDYLNDEYNNHFHKSIGMTPKESYLKDFGRLKFVEAGILDEQFLHRINRTVTNTATVSLFKVSYETPQKYIGKKIALRYNHEDMGEIYIYDELNEKMLHTVRPVRKTDNADRKRKSNIDYGKMG